MADLYTFIGAEQVTEFLPPYGSRQMEQATFQANDSQVVFLWRFLPEVYNNAGSVVETANTIAANVNEWAAEPGVEAMTPVQIVNASDQLVDKYDVEVSSTSGLSTRIIRVGYPMVDFSQIANAKFADAVRTARQQLDAVENG